jgi:membrane-bound lytic murein transglycosylase A
MAGGMGRVTALLLVLLVTGMAQSSIIRAERGDHAVMTPQTNQNALPAMLAPLTGKAEVKPLPFTALDGWAGDDHAAAFAAFRITCAAIMADAPSLRLAVPTPAGLHAVCERALRLGTPDSRAARAFFENHFTPFEIIPSGGHDSSGRHGFLTAYFEPEVEGSLVQTAEFAVPVLAKPDDLKAGKPYHNRAAIWAGALAGRGLEIAWLKDKAALFILQVQGSARLKLPDGRVTRLVYAGRNGRDYTSIGRILVENGEIALPDMSLARLMTWLRADAARGQTLMERNESYVFFARDDTMPLDQGPIGGAGVPLTTGRSLAVDRTFWPYGVPVFIEVSPLTPQGGRAPLNRLMVAQDTGSAIVGPARGDFFMGTGEAAGTSAGLVRDAMRFVVLIPKEKS